VRIPAKAKLDKLASKDASRPVLASLYLRIVDGPDGRRGYIEGTDSYKLGRVPVELDADDTEGFIPVDVFTAARKLRATNIVANGSLSLTDGHAELAQYPRPELGQFPNTDMLLDCPDATVDGRRFRIGVNPTLLLELAQGMGAATVVLEFTAHSDHDVSKRVASAGAPSPLRPIQVSVLDTVSKDNDTREATGLVMPVRIGPAA
jgi:hypothetical protein